MQETQNKESETKKTTIYSSKIFIGAGVVSLVALVVIVFFAKVVFSNFTAATPSADNGFETVKREELSQDPLITLTSLKPPIEDSDPVLGLEEAPVTIVEFGDFQCSYCSSMRTVLEDILKAYPNKVRLVWKDLPLHEQSYETAIAARCAQLQGKFWEMHDLLMDNYLLLKRESYSDFAQQLSLDLEDFNQCVDLKKPATLVDEDVKQAQTLKIDATPHYFINEREIEGTASYNDFSQLVELELGS